MDHIVMNTAVMVFSTREVIPLERELAAERSKNESLRAQLHGMQDGALLRDTQAALAVARKQAAEAERCLDELKTGFAIEKQNFVKSQHILADTITKERKRSDEAIHRLQHMHSAHSDSVQWYQNAVAQALKSLDALPAKLDFDEAMK
jgi:hypothetical protein